MPALPTPLRLPLRLHLRSSPRPDLRPGFDAHPLPRPDLPQPSPQPAGLRRRHCLGLGAGLLGAGWMGGLAATWAAPAAAAEPGHEWRPWPAGRAAPPLDLPLLDGGRWRLAEQRGHPVVLNFWASWCGPCRAEMPSLALMATRHADDGLVVLCVNYRESALAIRRFADEIDLGLPVALDADGQAAQRWTPQLFPTTVLVDRRGRPQGQLLGELDWASPAARARMAALLAVR